MNTSKKIKFDFLSEIKKGKTYAQLFPKREIGLTIIYLYEQFVLDNNSDKEFTEKDIRNAFIVIFGHEERQQTEDYNEYISDLQEYFLDYNQETQKYIFKDYAYRFCEQAKITLEGAFNPTKIRVLCEGIISLLKDIENDDTEKLKEWLENHYKAFEPKLREQIDFLEKQITNSVKKLKNDTKSSEQKFIDVLEKVRNSLDTAKGQNEELRTAYEQTKIIRTLLEERNIEDEHIGNLISDVNSFIKYTNKRLATIDKRLEKIQPRIKQLFSALNRRKFNSKIQSFTRYILKYSEVEQVGSKKEIVLPNNLQSLKVGIDTPNFTMLRKDIDLFPPKPRKVKTYKQNNDLRKKNREKVEKAIEQQKRIIHWETHILSIIELQQTTNLGQLFFKILNSENDIQIAVTTLFNVIRKIRNKEKFSIVVNKNELEQDNNFKHITLWKMEVQKR